MNMRKILSIIIGLVLMSTITSCQNEKKLVENDIKNIIEVSKKGDFKSLKGSEMFVMTSEAMGEGYKKMSYKINKITKENKNKIIVNITMKYPDLSESVKIFKNKVLEERQRLLKSSNPTVMSNEEILKLSMQFLKESINEKLNDPNLKYFEETFDIVYTKNNDNWEMQDSPQFNKAMIFNVKFDSSARN